MRPRIIGPVRPRRRGRPGHRPSGRRLPAGLRPWRKVVILLVAGLTLVFGRDGIGYLGARVAGTTTCRVTSVVDGDTIRVYCPGQGIERARLMGFDTPEVFSPRCASELWAGTQATWALQRRLWSADKVAIAFRGRDRYGRRLAILWVDGVNIARPMIEQGYARPYHGGHRRGWCG